MTQRAYICDMILFGDDDPSWAPCVIEYEHLWRAGVESRGTIGRYTDGREDIAQPGVGMAECDISDDVHEVLIADARITPLV